MNPHFFAESSHALFGIHTPARGVANTGVVICPPVGREGLTAHRSLRILADHLADAGVEVLRFDYFGTGDSAGTMRDGALAVWAENVRTASQHLRGLAPVRRVVVVGLRLGATLSLLAEVPATSALILWDPILDGRDFVAELSRSAADSRAEEWEVLGFPYGQRLRKELEAIDLGSLRRIPPEIRVIGTQEIRGLAALEKAVEARRTKLERAHVQAPRVWTEEEALGVGAIPAEVIRHIVGWVSA